MSPAETTIALVLAIGVIAFLMRWFTREEKVEQPSPPPDPVEALLAEVSGVDPEDASEVVAVTSEGWAFVPHGDDVQLVPPDTEDQFSQGLAGRGAPVNPRTGHPTQWKPGLQLDAGDLIGARVKRGAPGHDPWRLEALGRDRDYRAWFFETEAAARAALQLLERRIVRPPLDEDGEPQPPSPEDFDEARHLDEETERALDEDLERTPEEPSE